MPLKLNLGLSKKIGLPDYGSLGASCNVEIELEHSLLESDLDGFHDRVRKVYVACRQAVYDELARHQASAAQSEPEHLQLHASQPANGNGNGSSNGITSHQATSKQIEYAQQLAKQIAGLGVRRLDTVSHRLHSKPLVALTSLEASALIDLLKDIKAGRMQLPAVLNGAAA